MKIYNLDGQNGVEDIIPDFASYAKAEVEVLVVVGEMVLLHLAHVLWQLRVMKAISNNNQSKFDGTPVNRTYA